MPLPLPDNPGLLLKGANISADRAGATFSCWAPRARNVWICGSFNGWTQSADSLLNRHGDDWMAFMSGVHENATYKFYIEGEGTKGFKRDPYARELSYTPSYPRS